MKPESPKAVWMVWMRSDTANVFMAQPMHGAWMWCAHGPHGSQAGVEVTPGAAQAKAQSAAVVLDDASRWDKERIA